MPKSKRKAGVPQLPAPIDPLGVKSVYYNNIQLNFSGVDARIWFNEVMLEAVGIGESNKVIVERRANLVTTMEHFRAMVRVFQESLAAHDEKVKRLKEAKQ